MSPFATCRQRGQDFVVTLTAALAQRARHPSNCLLVSFRAGRNVTEISATQGQTILRVSRELEELPLLGQAVLQGEIERSQIREVVSVATVDTEKMWRDLCRGFNCKQIQDLVASTPKGGVPGEVASKLPRKTSEYRCRFQPEVVVLIERG